MDNTQSLPYKLLSLIYFLLLLYYIDILDYEHSNACATGMYIILRKKFDEKGDRWDVS